MAGFAKAFGAVTDAASTAWGFGKQLSNSSADQPKANILGVQSFQNPDLQASSLKPFEDSLNGMFTGMVKSGEIILENWMKHDGEEVEVFEQFSLLASKVVSKTAFGKNCLEANSKSPGTGGVVKKNDVIESKKHEQTKLMEDHFKNDFLGKLLVAKQESEKKKKISIEEEIEEEIADECKAFCFVGCTATASLLGWTIHMLAQDKNLQERARKEVIEIFGSEDPHPEGIAKLSIMDKILEDCERLYPLVPFNKMKVANGASEEQRGKAFQFGYGRGTCLGLNFAKIEAKVVLSMILRRFVVTLSPAYIHSPVHSFTVTPKHGIRVILRVLREESKTIKIIKTVGVVAGVAVAAWGITKLLGSFGPDEPGPRQQQKKKMMKNPGRPHELIERDVFELTVKQRFKMNRELKKAEKIAKAAQGIK